VRGVQDGARIAEDLLTGEACGRVPAREREGEAGTRGCKRLKA
jgi:hypothetical protein